MLCLKYIAALLLAIPSRVLGSFAAVVYHRVCPFILRVSMLLRYLSGILKADVSYVYSFRKRGRPVGGGSSRVTIWRNSRKLTMERLAYDVCSHDIHVSSCELITTVANVENSAMAVNDEWERVHAADETNLTSEEHKPAAAAAEEQGSSEGPVDLLLTESVPVLDLDSVPQSLEAGLIGLYQKHNWSLSSLGDLLQLLRMHNVGDLPKDPRTLIGTPRSIHVQVHTGAGGRKVFTYYLGLRKSLLYIFAVWPEGVKDGDVLQLQLNTDGVQVSRSTSSELWPVLGILRCRSFKSIVFCISLTFGGKCPSDPAQLFDEFVNEYNSHRNSGFDVHGRTLYVQISTVICDAPARSLTKGMARYNSYEGCDKCVTQGEWPSRMTFPDLRAPLRTDEGFANRQHVLHHASKYSSKESQTPLERAEVRMVSQIPIEPMHQLFLGVVRKICRLLVKSAPKTMKISMEI